MNMPVTALKTPVTESTHAESPAEPGVQRLPSPRQLKQQLVLNAETAASIGRHRQTIRDLLEGRDHRLLVVVGPCSIHDEDAALDYGRRLIALSRQLQDRLFIVMRTYVEKPRTSIGWKGLAYDPERNGRGDLQQGLTRSRRLFLRLAEMGLPLATEALNPLTMHYLDDLVSWTAIGARTAESQPHRELVSALPMPVGFKNGTDGSLAAAINGMKAAAQGHHGLGLDADGHVAMLDTAGNPDTHVVLRGGRGITNYDADSIARAQAALAAAGQNPKVMVDCSHDNACKQHERQVDIAREVAHQRAQGNHAILGIMLESFLEAGKQAMEGALAYGQSITDPCLGWSDTEALLRDLAVTEG
ncbi:3-deoxy-7-phosphoheptulonate synthase [Marinobacteraceae bacterium S3BR75-40.1]